MLKQLITSNKGTFFKLNKKTAVNNLLFIEMNNKPLFRSYATIKLSNLNDRSSLQQQSSTNNNNSDNNNNSNQQQEKDKSKSKPFTSVFSQIIIFGIPAIITFCLGIWQTKRLLWKLNQLKLREETLKTDPIPYDSKEIIKEELDNIQQAKSEYEYRLISFNGYFDYDKEIIIGLRKSPLTKRMDLPTSAGEMGYYIVTPFVVKETGEVILVNRGWVPQSIYEDKLSYSSSEFKKKKTNVSDIQTINGIIRPGEYVNNMDTNDGKSNKYIAIDLLKITKNLNLNYIPLLVDQICYVKDFKDQSIADTMLVATNSQPEKYPMVAIPNDYMKFYIMPESHVAYMVTWYSLCLWIVGTFVYLKRRKKLM
ncbi:hypothetical protein ABK040_009493 [Willaertia magna]